MTLYREAQFVLKATAEQLKREHPDDKPLIRLTLTSTMDWLCKEHQFSESKRHKLGLFVCKLYPR
jgi:hypothetical protein